MKSKLIAEILILTAFVAGPAWAGWHGAKGSSQLSTPASVKVSTFSLTLTILESSSNTSGPCTGGDGLADYCPTGDCTCYTYTGTVSGSAGNGSVTFYETFDNGGELDELNSGCAPAYGDIEINAKKDVESIAFNGADCGSAFTIPLLNGGCQIASSNIYTLGGLGECVGTYSQLFNTKFTIKGGAGK